MVVFESSGIPSANYSGEQTRMARVSMDFRQMAINLQDVL
jgi:hypothetical protein